MILLVDAGNTRLKVATYQSGELSEVHHLTENDVESWLNNIERKDIENCIVSSVCSSEVLARLIKWFERYQLNVQLLKSNAKYKGLINSYAEPEKLGIDRWLAMLGARKLVKNRPFIIIDAGTATTLDCIDGQGKHLGGWIMPGITLLSTSLNTKTENISVKHECENSLSLGENTVNAVNHGALAATLGFIEQGCLHMDSSHENFKIIITGGNAIQLNRLIVREHIIESKLIFLGMLEYC